MSISEDETDFSLGSVFTELPRPPSPEPTITTYHRDPQYRQATPKDLDASDWFFINIRLVGAHPLWGHYLWNAARSFATYLDANPHLYRDRHVLELGAGGGLPGIVVAKNGARKVILTDYPDKALIENLEFNVTQNIPPVSADRVKVMGYIWGHSVHPLLASLSIPSIPKQGFDLIILSDLVFNHSQHDALLNTCEEALRPLSTSGSEPSAPTVLVFYTHHRPHLAYRDLEFFTKARERKWICEEIVQDKFPPMFPEDPGAEEVRSTVHGWRLTRAPRLP